MSRYSDYRASRRSSDFNLSFLDIMGCGLGAVILIFLIIKHNVDHGSIESDVLVQQLESLQREAQQLQSKIDNIAQLNSEEQLLGEELAQRRQSSQTALGAIDERITNQQTVNAQLQASNKETLEQQSADIVEDTPRGEEQYLVGLKVEGPRIAILVDRSASMTDENLIDVFRYKVGTDPERRAAPKWRRAKRTVRWLLNRVPANSQVTVLGFGEQSESLGPAGWFQTSQAQAVTDTLAQLEQLTPTGPTNLQVAFEQLRSLSPAPSDVYVITDGLPTKVTGRMRRCARGDTVSPRCRLELFSDMRRGISSQLSQLKLNVVLLPLEGDWDAANAYWNLAVATGGLMISPPRAWP